MTGPLRLNRCMLCGRRRPGEEWALGLEALLGEDRVAWLCDDCEALPGRAWEFLDAVRSLYPEATIVSTTAPGGTPVRAPLVAPPAPDAAAGEPGG